MQVSGCKWEEASFGQIYNAFGAGGRSFVGSSLVLCCTSIKGREQAVPVPYEMHAVGGWHCLPLSNIILRQANLDTTPGDCPTIRNLHLLTIESHGRGDLAPTLTYRAYGVFGAFEDIFVKVQVGAGFPRPSLFGVFSNSLDGV